MRPLRVIISGGGTGGHIFPAVAIANAIKKIKPDTEFLFVGAEGRMEMEKVPAAGYKIEGLWISGIQRKLTLANLSIPFKIISSLLKAGKIINRFKPDVAIGTGGYASGPMLRKAISQKIPSLIQEQNSFPGITNKLLAKKVDKICVAYEGMDKYFPKEKVILTGNPVREEMVDLKNKKTKAAEFFGLNPDKKTLLVIGGSLGARTINESINLALGALAQSQIQLIWQTGKGYITTATEAVAAYTKNGIKSYDFISKMDYAYAMADVVVSRAGAISVSELTLVKKPVILVPSPNVAEDHQTKNAMALVNKNAAVLVKDIEAKEKLGSTIIALMNDGTKQQELKDNIARLALANSAELIANEVLKLVEVKNKGK